MHRTIKEDFMEQKYGFTKWITGRIQGFQHKVSPSQAILITFLGVITLGTILLSLPVASASRESAGVMTALFTTTSAVCVTGLVVVETATFWSLFGKIVIIGLIQIGGLGLLTIMALVLVISGKKITLTDRLVIQTAFNQENIRGMIRLVKTVIFGTLIVEGVAAIILTVRFLFEPGVSPIQALGFGVFHAISGFCNAGFDVLGSESLAPYVGDPIINLVIMSLISLGGLGFSVWRDLAEGIRNPPPNNSFKNFFRTRKLHTKIAMTMTVSLICGGALFFFLSEYTNPATMGNLTFGEKIWASFFHSVTLRTAGFYSISQGGLTHASKFMSVLLMAVGGSPGGTAGGIKTVTVGVLIFSILSAFKGKDSAHAYHRKISNHNVLKALTVTGVFIGIIIVATMLLGFTERNMIIPHDFMDLLFETTSATGTVGLTTGITPYLSTAGKLIVVLCMYLGRTGPLTMVIALNRKLEGRSDRLEYPEEEVLIG